MNFPFPRNHLLVVILLLCVKTMGIRENNTLSLYFFRDPLLDMLRQMEVISDWLLLDRQPIALWWKWKDKRKFRGRNEHTLYNLLLVSSEYLKTFLILFTPSFLYFDPFSFQSTGTLHTPVSWKWQIWDPVRKEMSWKYLMVNQKHKLPALMELPLY